MKKCIITLLYCALLFMGTIALGACGNNESRIAASSPPPATVYPSGLAGTVQIRGSCVFVQSSLSPTPTEYALIWPSLWTVDVAGDRVIVQPPNEGKLTLANGERVELDGGEIKTVEGLPEAQRARVSPDCTGPYWLVGIRIERKS